MTLELTHEKSLVEDNSVRVFTHSAKEFEPVVGRVGGQTSRWMTLVPGERDTDVEFSGQCIRHIKRPLKRPWPEAFESKVLERIFIQPNAFGQQTLKAKEPYRFPELPRLFLANHLLAMRAGELGAFEVVQDVSQLNTKRHRRVASPVLSGVRPPAHQSLAWDLMLNQL